MGRRTLLLLASILVAAAGTAMIWVYVQGADERAQSRWGSRTVVLRATKSLSVGDGPVEVKAATVKVDVPRTLVPDRPVSSADQLIGKAAVVPVAPGSLLTLSQFDAAQAPADVRAGTVAVAVPLGDQARVAGLLHPGSLVAVYLVEQQGQQAGQAKAAAARPQRAFVLIPHIRVKGLGNVTAARNSRGLPAQVGTQKGVAAGDVMLEADHDQAIKLILAANSGHVLWLTVLNNEKDAPRADAAITIDQLLNTPKTR